MSRALKIYGLAFIYSAISGKQMHLFIKCPTFQEKNLHKAFYCAFSLRQNYTFRGENNFFFFYFKNKLENGNVLIKFHYTAYHFEEKRMLLKFWFTLNSLSFTMFSL